MSGKSKSKEMGAEGLTMAVAALVGRTLEDETLKHARLPEPTVLGNWHWSERGPGTAIEVEILSGMLGGKKLSIKVEVVAAEECECKDVWYEQLPSGAYVTHGDVCSHCRSIVAKEQGA